MVGMKSVGVLKAGGGGGNGGGGGGGEVASGSGVDVGVGVHWPALLLFTHFGHRGRGCAGMEWGASVMGRGG